VVELESKDSSFSSSTLSGSIPLVDPSPEEQALEAQLRLTSDLVSAQKLPEAEIELVEAQRLSPRDVRVLKLLALVRFKLGRLPEARQVYREALDIAPEEPTIRLNLGLIALKMESFSEAALELEAAVRLQPDDRRAWSYLGYAYAKNALPAQAATAFRRFAHWPNWLIFLSGYPKRTRRIAAIWPIFIFLSVKYINTFISLPKVLHGLTKPQSFSTGTQRRIIISPCRTRRWGI